MSDIGMYRNERPFLSGRTLFSEAYGYRTSPADGPVGSWKRSQVKLNDLLHFHSSDSARMDYVNSYRTGVSDLDSISRLFLGNERRNAKVRGDTGHEFDLMKFTAKTNPRYEYLESYFDDSAGRKYWGYRGPIGLFNGGIGTESTTSFEGLGSNGFTTGAITDVDIALGARAIAACAPTKSEASIAASLLELKDGFPKMLGRNLKDGSGPQAIGSEYLNYIFGWLPTISDVKQIAIAMVNANKIILQYERDADKIVRRRFSFPKNDQTRSATDSLYGYQVMVDPPPIGTSNNPLGMWGGAGLESNGSYNATLVRRDYTRVWFSGAFRYHLAVGDDVFSRIERTSQIASKWLGARLDANAFWQAMPWSWFIDWLSDIGVLIQNGNAAALDGQVLQWGYLMKHTLITKTFTTDSQMIFRHPERVTRTIGNLSTTFVTERKQRVKATPYGFGINPDSFSAQQWAILGALGLTRGPNKLW